MKLMNFRWLLIFFVFFSINANASMVTDFEVALQKDDISAARAIVLKMRDDWWYKNDPDNLSQYDNLIDRVEAIDQFLLAAESYLTTNENNQAKKANELFKKLLDLERLNAKHPYQVSQATIDGLNEKSKKANDKIEAIWESQKKQQEIAMQAADAARLADEQKRLAEAAEAQKLSEESLRELEKKAEKCPKDALYAGCPWNGKLASHNGRFSIEEMAPEIAAPLLKRYNHTPNGCTHPANRVVGQYSRYQDGQLFYLHDNTLEQSEILDRIMLRDMLDRKVKIDLSKIHLMDCKHASEYMPTKQTYTMPEDTMQFAK